MIVNIYKYGPMIVAAAAVITLSFYHLDKQYSSIMEELTRREAAGVL